MHCPDPIAVIGSRKLSDTLYPHLFRIFRAIAKSGSLVRTGCCLGVDAAIIDYFVSHDLADRLEVSAIFDAIGTLSCSTSAVRTVLHAAQAGAHVAFLAGGQATIPTRARLLIRSRAVIEDAAAVLGLLDTPKSSGTLAVLSLAARAGQPIVAFSPAGMPYPLRANGTWDHLPLSTPVSTRALAQLVRSATADAVPLGLSYIFYWTPPPMLPGFDREETQCPI